MSENRYYDKWKNYSKDHLRRARQFSHPIRSLIVSKTLEVGDNVLEMGSASCIDYPSFTRANIDYTAIDVTEKFIEHAKELYPRINAYVGDALHCPWENNSFHVVYTKDVLAHLPPGVYKSWIDEMWRLASRRIIIAFYLAPTDSETVYKKGGQKLYVNKYNKEELLNKIDSLSGVKNKLIIEEIGYNNSALWIIDKSLNP